MAVELKGVKAIKLTLQCRRTITFSTLKIMLAKISFYYEQEQFSGRKALKLFKELFIGDF